MKLFSTILFFICVHSAFAQTDLTTGLLACYPFNGNANDASGNKVNGTVYGAALSTDRFGNANQAYYFDGVNDYIDIYNPSLFGSAQWTYSAWVKVKANPALHTNGYIIGIGGGSSGGAQDLAINNEYVISDKGFIISSYHSAGNTPSYCLSGTLPTLDTWYHVVGVRETDTVRLFVNGVQVSKFNTLSTAITYGTANSAFIGSRAAGTELFNGSIDDIKIYSRPLNAIEVKALYASTTLCNDHIAPVVDLTKGLLACYPFNGNANDASGNKVNGTVYGGASLSTDRFGNVNQAYYFDGVNDYIDIYNPSLFGSAEWTYSAWVKVTTNPALHTNAYIIGIGGGGSGGAQDLAINNEYVVSDKGFIVNSYHVAGNTPSYCLSGTLPTLNTWYHVVGMREADTVRIFVNGLQVSKSKTLSTAITYGTANSAFIGSRAAGTELFNGYMDDIKIYSRPLTKAEVNELYTSSTICNNNLTTGILDAHSTTETYVVYPNPTSGVSTVKFPNTAAGMFDVQVADSKGTLVMSASLSSTTPEIDLSSLHKGVYMVSFMQNGEMKGRSKIIIQ